MCGKIVFQSTEVGKDSFGVQMWGKIVFQSTEVGKDCFSEYRCVERPSFRVQLCGKTLSEYRCEERLSFRVQKWGKIVFQSTDVGKDCLSGTHVNGFNYCTVQRPWVLGIHGPKNRGGRLHREAISMYMCIMYIHTNHRIIKNGGGGGFLDGDGCLLGTLALQSSPLHSPSNTHPPPPPSPFPSSPLLPHLQTVVRH